jgi:hypothetical protein
MTRGYFATNRLNPNPTNKAGHGADIVDLDENQMIYASVDVMPIALKANAEVGKCLTAPSLMSS